MIREYLLNKDKNGSDVTSLNKSNENGEIKPIKGIYLILVEGLTPNC